MKNSWHWKACVKTILDVKIFKLSKHLETTVCRKKKQHWRILGMHRNYKIQFRSEPEFAGTRNKNPAENWNFLNLGIFMNHNGASEWYESWGRTNIVCCSLRHIIKKEITLKCKDNQ